MPGTYCAVLDEETDRAALTRRRATVVEAARALVATAGRPQGDGSA